MNILIITLTLLTPKHLTYYYKSLHIELLRSLTPIFLLFFCVSIILYELPVIYYIRVLSLAGNKLLHDSHLPSAVYHYITVQCYVLIKLQSFITVQQLAQQACVWSIVRGIEYAEGEGEGEGEWGCRIGISPHSTDISMG